jgi:hypothetical protein
MSKESRIPAPRRMFLLTGVFVVTTVLAVLVLPSDPLIAARLQEIMHPSLANARPTFDPDASSKMDLVPGSSLPDLGAGKEIRAMMPPSISTAIPVMGYMTQSTPIGAVASTIMIGTGNLYGS